MNDRIPTAVAHADLIYHSILKKVAFSRHLNPTNAREARQAFMAGAECPPFSYIPLRDADDLLRLLNHNEPPRSHPAGLLVGKCFDSLRLLIRALSERSAQAFDA